MWQDRLKIGCQIARSANTVWLTTEADSQSSLTVHSRQQNYANRESKTNLADVKTALIKQFHCRFIAVVCRQIISRAQHTTGLHNVTWCQCSYCFHRVINVLPKLQTSSCRFANIINNDNCYIYTSFCWSKYLSTDQSKLPGLTVTAPWRLNNTEVHKDSEYM